MGRVDNEVLRKQVRQLILSIKQRAFRNELLEKEVDIEVAYLMKRCAESKKEPPSVIALLDIERVQHKNMSFGQLLDFEVIKDGKHYWCEFCMEMMAGHVKQPEKTKIIDRRYVNGKKQVEGRKSSGHIRDRRHKTS